MPDEKVMFHNTVHPVRASIWYNDTINEQDVREALADVLSEERMACHVRLCNEAVYDSHSEKWDYHQTWEKKPGAVAEYRQDDDAFRRKRHYWLQMLLSDVYFEVGVNVVSKLITVYTVAQPPQWMVDVETKRMLAGLRPESEAARALVRVAAPPPQRKKKGKA